VQISDSEWCGDAGSLGASCFHTLSDQERDIEKDQWDQERFGMVCTSAETLAEWKAAILKLCKDTKRCDYETKKKIVEFGKKLRKVTNER
jgi:hypothetical protein